MATPTSITAVRASLRIVFGTHEVFAAGATVARAAKYTDLVYEI